MDTNDSDTGLNLSLNLTSRTIWLRVYKCVASIRGVYLTFAIKKLKDPLELLEKDGIIFKVPYLNLY